MTAPLLLAFMLIQAPNSAPQAFQPEPATRYEPVLAAGIKVTVVEAPAVQAESYAAPMAPISTASYVGVVPRMSPCRWAAAGFGGRMAGTSPCEYLNRWSPSGAFMTGSPYQEWVAWQVRGEENRLAASRAAAGRAIREANAAKGRPAAPPARQSSIGTGGGRSYSGANSTATGGAGGGGRTTGGGTHTPVGKRGAELP